MTLLRLRSSGPQWPYSVAQFRADEPHLSISYDPHPGELASYAELNPPILLFQAQPTDPPKHDPAAQRVEEVMPVEVDGLWQQAWQLIDLPPVPPAPPMPDWGAFKSGLLVSESVAQVMGAAREAGCEPAVTNLPVALEKAQGGNVGEFAACWGLVASAGGATPQALAALVVAAQAANLPAEFVGALQPTPERARDEQGRFIADDPATPEDEAWVPPD